MPIAYTPARDTIYAESLLGNHQRNEAAKNKSLKTIGKAPDINAFLRMLVDVVLEITIKLYILKVIL